MVVFKLVYFVLVIITGVTWMAQGGGKNIPQIFLLPKSIFLALQVLSSARYFPALTRIDAQKCPLTGNCVLFLTHRGC